MLNDGEVIMHQKGLNLRKYADVRLIDVKATTTPVVVATYQPAESTVEKTAAAG